MPRNFYDRTDGSERNLKIIWGCDQCGADREEYPDCNEGGQCSCGGTFQKMGESYLAHPVRDRFSFR